MERSDVLKPARLLVIIRTHQTVSMFSNRRQPFRSINIDFSDEEFKKAFLECRLGTICNRWVIKSPISTSCVHQEFVAKMRRKE